MAKKVFMVEVTLMAVVYLDYDETKQDGDNLAMHAVTLKEQLGPAVCFREPLSMEVRSATALKIPRECVTAQEVIEVGKLAPAQYKKG